MLSSSEKYELKKKFRHLESQICKIDTALDSKADLVDGVVPTEQLPITQDIIDALNNANAPTGINYFTTLADLSSITPGTLINVAANYSALPAANTVPGEFYWVENSQGTSWLPGPLGGTYYPNGLYYSNGTTWIFTDVPFNATQVEVDAGLNNNKFVTPQTFANAAKWDTKFDNWTVTTANTGTLTGENVLWLVDTTAARTRTLDSAGSYVHIKDTTGNALTNNITINAPVGQTINGNASETIDADFGWVEYKLVGTDWVTTEGDSGAASNQLIVDSTPTNGSTNPVSSDGVYDALQLKQDNVTLTTTGTSGAATLVGSTLNIPQYQSVLTNPVTGTGTAGQVSYWSGTGTQTGSSNLFWDAVNGRLGVGKNNPLEVLDVYGNFKIQSANANNAVFSITTNTLGATATVTGGSLNTRIFYFSPGGGDTRFFTSGVNSKLSVWDNTATQTVELTSNTTSYILNSFSLGTTTSSARLHVRGSGTTSATTALLVQNSTPASLLSVTDDGVITIGTTTNIFNTGSRTTFSSVGGANVNQFRFTTTNTLTSTSGIVIFSENNPTFNPTSGTATFSLLNINPIINQTGGANGITRGLYVNPVLTAAADWRSVEWSNNTGWGLYGAGTANNYLGGGLGIGTATLNNSALRINRAVTGSTIVSSISNASTINSDVTSNAWMYVSGPSTQAATFNLSELVHFNAFNLTIGTNSTISNQSGFNVSSNIIGATNNYGFRGQIASGTGRWNLYMDGTAANYLAGDTSIGTTTSSARLHVRGSGTTSSTTALLVQNSTATELFKVADNGAWNFNGDGIVKGSGNTSGTTALTVQNSDGTTILTVRNDNRVIASNGFRVGGILTSAGIFPDGGTTNFEGLLIRSSNGQDFTGTDITISNGQGNGTATSGTRTLVGISRGFAPTSGTGVWNTLSITSTINQTGGANGITRGLYVNPTLTAAADWRSVEFSNNTGWGLYGAGTAANYLAGNTSIGTTTSSGRLTVQGSGTTSSTKALVVNNSTPTAIFEILDNGRINQTIPLSSSTTLFGTAAGAAALTGSGNTFIGTSAGNSTTTGSNNAALGFSSGLSNTTGANNVFFGSSAGRGNVDGSRNIFIGNAAGRYISDGSTANTKPDDSVFIGSETRAAANTQTNQIVIGYQAIGNGSNTATLGNASITATYLRGNINYTDGGNFVIGTTTGTKIGTATSQKIGFWNATPIVQPTTAVAAATRVGGGGTTVTDSDTFDGYTIAQLVKALRNMGALA